jgi:hypothetical protein
MLAYILPAQENTGNTMNRFIAKRVLYKKNDSYSAALQKPFTGVHAGCGVDSAECSRQFSLPLYPLYGILLSCVTAIGVYGYMATGIAFAY